MAGQRALTVLKEGKLAKTSMCKQLKDGHLLHLELVNRDGVAKLIVQAQVLEW